MLTAELTALKRLSLAITVDADLSEAFCPSSCVPRVTEFFDDLPTLQAIETVQHELMVRSRLFNQNRSYRWADRLDTFIIGRMWLSQHNYIEYRAVHADMPYTWHGLDLRVDYPVVTWDDLWEQCRKLETERPHPMRTFSDT